MLHKILVALDDSVLSKQVFDKAIDLAKTSDACLLLLQVLPHLSEVDDPSNSNPSYTIKDHSNLSDLTFKSGLQQWQYLQNHGLQLLGACTAQADDADVTTEFMQNQGTPGETICALAQTWKADLIVMGHRDRSALEQTHLESVSHYVLDHTPCSVLVVHPQPDKSIEERASQIASVF